MSTRGASDLKQRLDRARLQHRRRESDSGADTSGVHPLQREVAPPPPMVGDAASVRAAAPDVAVTGASSHPTRWHAIGRGVGLAVLGAAVGIAAVRSGLWDAAPGTPPLATSASPPVRQSSVEQAAAVPRTELVTDPPGAEVVLRGAVIANTPTQVARPAYEALYLLRLSGYYPQLIRVSPQSGDAIVVRLRPLGEQTPVSDVSLAARGTDTQPAPVGRPRGNDVGRQSAIGRSDRPSAGGRTR